LVAIQVRNLLRGLGFAAGIAGALLILWLAALGMTRALRRWFPSRLTYTVRQGLANLYRPAHPTVAVGLSLGFGAFLLGALATSQSNLLRQLTLDGGAGRPNLVFFDVQPDQKAAIERLLAEQHFPVQPSVPIVPMRIKSIDGISASQILSDTLSHGKE